MVLVIRWVTLEPRGSVNESDEVFTNLVSDVKDAYAEIRENKLSIDKTYLGTSDKYLKGGPGGTIQIMDYSGKSWITRQKRYSELKNKLTNKFGYSVDAEIVKKDGQEIAKMSDIPQLTEVTVNGIYYRTVYGLGGKEYVKDDLGVLTRRYAYCVRQKSLSALRPHLKPLPLTLAGTYEPETTYSAAYTEALFAIKNTPRSRWHLLSENAKLFLAYLNYSNNGQFGICLSSTTKKIRDNKGQVFLNNEGYNQWEIDLARIPMDVVLVNLYADTRKIYGKPKLNDVEKLGKDGTDWVAQGTIKNRELFCSYLPDAACTTSLTTKTQVDSKNFVDINKPRVSEQKPTAI